MNPAPTLTLAPPAVEQRAQAPAPARTRTMHGVDAVRVLSVDSSRPDPRWGA